MSESAFLKVPMIEVGEVGLMGVLDYIVQHYRTSNFPRALDDNEIGRAVDWLHAKYGTHEGER
jgi:hypothetical protein